MFTKVLPSGEYHSVGGDGIIFACDVVKISEKLIKEYGGKVQLIFIDPPSDASSGFEFKTRLAARPYEIKYDSAGFMDLMRKTLQTCKSLLCPEGSIYIRVSPRMNGRMRALADEIFGEKNLVNEIIWAFKTSGRAVRYFSCKHDNLLFYRKSKSVYFNIKAVGLPRDMEKRNHMKRQVDENGKIFFSVRSGEKEYRYYEDDHVYPGDVWDDIDFLTKRDPGHTGYAGQLPETLLKRIILASSREGDIVFDPFMGSGTTAAASLQLGRKFIAADISPASLFVSRSRLTELNKAPEWFKKHMPLQINYSEESAKASAPESPLPEQFLKFTETDGGCIAEIPAVKSPLCCYIAVGKLRNDIFYAEDYIMHPVAGSKLILKRGDAIHITDGNCNSYFYQYD